MLRQLGIFGISALLFVAQPSIALDVQSTQQSRLSESERNTIEIFKQTSPLVVNVYMMRRLYSMDPVSYMKSGAGSGFFWDKQGHIVTNYHVVRNADRLAVSVGRGKTVFAKVIGVEPLKDIAVLKLNVKNPESAFKNLPELKIADSSQLQVGQNTLAIGNPFGLDRTLTTGIISALGRRIQGSEGLSAYDMIQTDASINPGNSGGILLNSDGELIGMNSIIFSKSGASAGIGFAVPSNTIQRVVSQIIQYGEVIHRSLGIQMLDVRLASQLSAPGLIIGKVLPGTPAAKAGLRGTYRDDMGEIIFGDIIVAIDNKRIMSFSDYNNVLDSTLPEQMIEVKFIRNKKLQSVKMKAMNHSSLKASE